MLELDAKSDRVQDSLTFARNNLLDVLLLDKTGTITLGNRQASTFVPAPGVPEEALADAAQLSSFADETPEGQAFRARAEPNTPRS